MAERQKGLAWRFAVELSRKRFGLATFPAVYSRAILARALAERGVFDEADTHGQEAIRMGFKQLERRGCRTTTWLGKGRLPGSTGSVARYSPRGSTVFLRARFAPPGG